MCVRDTSRVDGRDGPSLARAFEPSAENRRGSGAWRQVWGYPSPAVRRDDSATTS